MQLYLVMLFSQLLDSTLFLSFQSSSPHKYTLNQNLLTLDLTRNLFSRLEIYSPLNRGHINDDPVVEAGFESPQHGFHQL
jgi:hypothetical protein